MARATVITDASYDHKTGKAGWAAWIRIDGMQPIKAYGAFKGRVSSSLDAEAKAAANGIALALKNGASEVLLQTDCLIVVHYINGVTKKPSALKKWRSIVRKTGIKRERLTARHVKGHSATQDARSYVNRWCDEHANKARIAS